jgi:hypothetical protein
MGTYLSTPKTDKETGARAPSGQAPTRGIVLQRHAPFQQFSVSRRVLHDQHRASAEFGHGAKLSYGMCGMQGWRRTMEDAHICAAKLHDRDDMSLFGVFDGHGGAEVAQFCAKYLTRELLNSEHFKSGDFDKALKDVFHQMDRLLSDEAYASEIATVRVTTPRHCTLELFLGTSRKPRGTFAVAIVTSKQRRYGTR